MAKEIFYHGTTRLFDHFDISHALEGDGKAKFGFGVYVTSKFATAALYAGKHPSDHYYVYTVEVPEKMADNSLSYRHPVAPSIKERVEERLDKETPEKYLANGRFFRKYVALSLAGKRIPPNPDNAKPKAEDEKAVSEWLLSVGVDFFEWPQGSWTKPTSMTNRCILDDKAIRIVRIEEVELNKDKKLVEGSQKTIFEV